MYENSSGPPGHGIALLLEDLELRGGERLGEGDEVGPGLQELGLDGHGLHEAVVEARGVGEADVAV